MLGDHAKHLSGDHHTAMWENLGEVRTVRGLRRVWTRACGGGEGRGIACGGASANRERDHYREPDHMY